MKCRKCGNEITSLDKYCNNCGAEIVKPATYYCPKCKKEFKKKLNFCNVCGAKLKIKLETMPCPHCGETIPKNAVLCSYCYKDLNPNNSNFSNKKGNDKPFYSYPKFWIASIGFIFLVIFFIVVGYNAHKSMDEAVMEAHTHNSTEAVTEQPTTTDDYTDAERDTDFTLEDMTFTIPKNWKYEYHKDFDWIELAGPNGGTVQISVENEDLKDSIAEVNRTIDDFKSAGINVINSDEKRSDVGGKKATFIHYAVKLGNVITYNYVYVVQYDDNTYTLQNSFYGKEAINDNSVFIGDIVNSVKFKSNKKKIYN